jgi:hypothetical protein
MTCYPKGWCGWGGSNPLAPETFWSYHITLLVVRPYQGTYSIPDILQSIHKPQLSVAVLHRTRQMMSARLLEVHTQNTYKNTSYLSQLNRVNWLLLSETKQAGLDLNAPDPYLRVTWFERELWLIDFCGFSQSLQANSGIVPELNQKFFLSSPVSIHLPSYHPKLCNLNTEKISLNNAQRKLLLN